MFPLPEIVTLKVVFSPPVGDSIAKSVINPSPKYSVFVASPVSTFQLTFVFPNCKANNLSCDCYNSSPEGAPTPVSIYNPSPLIE